MHQGLIFIAVASIISGCVHTVANPVQVAQIGDESKSCRAIVNEIEEMKALILSTQSEGNVKTAKNVGLGVAGAFLLVPWFFMDLGNAPTVEQKAAQARIKRLTALYEDKKCAGPTTDSAIAPALASSAAALNSIQ
jgi:hypothetical protein